MSGVRGAGFGVMALCAIAIAACGEGVEGPGRQVRFADVSAGPEHACGVSTDADAYCWGAGPFGELAGVGGPLESALPVRVDAPGLRFQRVSAGYSHSCGLIVGGQVYCWGWGVYGQLGAGKSTTGGPTLVVGEHRFVAVESGWYHTCGVTDGGVAYCWGLNDRGQIGDGTRANAYSPVAVAGGLRFTQLSAGAAHTCGVTVERRAYCWGSNELGQLGTGDVVDALSPKPVSGGLSFQAITAGASHSCGLLTDGAAYCWGSNGYGELGTSAIERLGIPGATTPVAVFGGRGYLAIDAGRDYTCAIGGDRVGYCWGYGLDGQLGTGLLTSSVTPLTVAGPSGPSGPDGLILGGLSAGGLTYACGVTVEGGAFCWGRGDAGQLGHASLRFSPLPVRIPGAR